MKRMSRYISVFLISLAISSFIANECNADPFFTGREPGFWNSNVAMLVSVEDVTKIEGDFYRLRLLPVLKLRGDAEVPMNPHVLERCWIRSARRIDPETLEPVEEDPLVSGQIVVVLLRVTESQVTPVDVGFMPNEGFFTVVGDADSIRTQELQEIAAVITNLVEYESIEEMVEAYRTIEGNDQKFEIEDN